MALASGFSTNSPVSSADEEPVRVFKSDALERLTHVNPIWIPAFWLPVTALLMYLDPGARNLGLAKVALAMVIGAVLVWTFIEYVLHRFVFHFKPRTPFQERVLFMIHEVHHLQPNCKTRLVMPLPVSGAISVLFYLLFRGLVGNVLGMPDWVISLFAGALLGYVAYDMTHYAVHHFPIRNRLFKALKRHHMLHHFDDPATRYGVTSPVWDYVFKTQKGSFWGKGR
jgi:sterol desaturase/sphingolipid hydroxylase (fatty acid hydroxylase superfamily)